MALTYMYIPLAYLKSCRDFIVSGDVSKVRRLKTQRKSKKDGTSWQTEREREREREREKTEAYMGREGDSEGWIDGWRERETERESCVAVYQHLFSIHRDEGCVQRSDRNSNRSSAHTRARALSLSLVLSLSLSLSLSVSKAESVIGSARRDHRSD